MEVANDMKGEACMKTHTSNLKWRFRDSWCQLGGGPLFVAVSGSHQMRREMSDLQEARYSPHPHLSVFLSSRLTCECETLENSNTYLMLFLPRKHNLMRMVSFT